MPSWGTPRDARDGDATREETTPRRMITVATMPNAKILPARAMRFDSDSSPANAVGC